MSQIQYEGMGEWDGIERVVGVGGKLKVAISSIGTQTGDTDSSVVHSIRHRNSHSQHDRLRWSVIGSSLT